MRKVFALIVAAASLAGCAVQRTATVGEPFNAVQAAAMMRPGQNTITGSALMRQNGGGVVTCAGNPVHLIPATDYAIRRMAAIYGSGHVVGVYNSRVSFTDDDPVYRQNIRTAACNAQGFFRFDQVGDGEFFVQTTVIWTPSTYNVQGGSVMNRVNVKGGQAVDVVLAP